MREAGQGEKSIKAPTMMMERVQTKVEGTGLNVWTKVHLKPLHGQDVWIYLNAFWPVGIDQNVLVLVGLHLQGFHLKRNLRVRVHPPLKHAPNQCYWRKLYRTKAESLEHGVDIRAERIEHRSEGSWLLATYLIPWCWERGQFEISSESIFACARRELWESNGIQKKIMGADIRHAPNIDRVLISRKQLTLSGTFQTTFSLVAQSFGCLL